MEFGVTEAHDGIWSLGLKDVAQQRTTYASCRGIEPLDQLSPGLTSVVPTS